MNKIVFYKCPVCGNLAVMIKHLGLNPLCCGEPMKTLLPNQQAAAVDKHIPVIPPQAYASLRINEVPEGWEEAFCPICEKTA